MLITSIITVYGLGKHAGIIAILSERIQFNNLNTQGLKDGFEGKTGYHLTKRSESFLRLHFV